MRNYEDRIRHFSNPDKVFHYFASVSRGGKKYMTADDFLRSLFHHESSKVPLACIFGSDHPRLCVVRTICAACSCGSEWRWLDFVWGVSLFHPTPFQCVHITMVVVAECCSVGASLSVSVCHV